MHTILAKRVIVSTALAILATTTGCAVRTRLGAMIPGHVNSEKLEGEMVTATFIPLVPKPPAARPEMIPGAAEAAGALVKVGVDALRKELLREAEKYEHQCSTRLLVTTKDLDTGGVILITRWVDNPDIKKKSGSAESSQSDLIPPLDTQIQTAVPESALGDKIKTILSTPPREDKMAVTALTLRVTSAGDFVYRFSGARLWVKAVGAKVVDFGWRNVPKIWQWPGALIFATDAQMGFTATMNTKALVATKIDDNNNVTEGKWVDILPESDVLGSVNINLDKLPMVTPIGSQLGSWMMVPTIGGKAHLLGFAVMNFRFTERDSSNAKKYIEQAADGLKNNESALSDLAKKMVGSDR